MIRRLFIWWFKVVLLTIVLALSYNLGYDKGVHDAELGQAYENRADLQ